MASVAQDDIIRSLLAARARLSGGFIPVPRDLRPVTPGGSASVEGLVATVSLLNSYQEPTGLEIAEFSIAESP